MLDSRQDGLGVIALFDELRQRAAALEKQSARSAHSGECMSPLFLRFVEESVIRRALPNACGRLRVVGARRRTCVRQRKQYSAPPRTGRGVGG